jgi:trans-aconitate methyltransferase
MSDSKNHWETVFANKQPYEVSWTQDTPQTSLDFIDSFNLPKTASIIDIGGGDSKLVDCLLEKGYLDITVLDISANALERAKLRLGDKAAHVKWIVSDITEFKTEQRYDIWHDRAAFHFLTTEEQVEKYLAIAQRLVNRFIAIGTFSENGPQKCSGLEIQQYSERSLQEKFAKGFQKIKCIGEDHITPFQTKQNFLFCSFLAKRTSLD